MLNPSPASHPVVDPTHHTHSVSDMLATLLSWVLVPTLVPVYAMILILWLSPLSLTTPISTRLIVVGVTFALTCILPMVIVYILKLMGVVTDVGLNLRRERAIPYAAVLVSYLLTAWYLDSHGAPVWVTMFYVGGGLATLINLIINFKWKISAHSAAMGGVCVVMLRIAHAMPETSTLTWLCIWFLLTGLLGTSRIWLRRHTLLQVLAGCAAGAIAVGAMLLVA